MVCNSYCSTVIVRIQYSGLFRRMQIWEEMFKYLRLLENIFSSHTNICYASVGLEEAGVNLIKLLCWNKTFIVGSGSNLRHLLWDPGVDQARTNWDYLIDWYFSKCFEILNPMEVLTNNYCVSLDPAFCIYVSVIYEALVDPYGTLDHEKLVTILHWL